MEMEEGRSRRSSELLTLLPKNSKKCMAIAACVIVQCLIVIIGASTILECFYSPDKAFFEFDELARIMYLYDFRACRPDFNFTKAGTSDIKLATITYGLRVRPIEWMPVILTPMTKTPNSTRRHMKISISLHAVWMANALVVLLVRYKKNIQLKSVRLILGIFYYATLTMIIYDVSMGVLYAAHVQRSLTKGMILRYSGRNIAERAAGNNEFAGWVPMIASICWMRGLIFFALNIYFCRIINYIRTKISKRIFQKKRHKDYHKPFPDAHFEANLLDSDPSILYYRSDENEATLKKSTRKFITITE